MLAAVENAPEIMDASEGIVKQCDIITQCGDPGRGSLVASCDDGSNVQREVLVASCVDGQTDPLVVQCDIDDR